MTESCSAHEKEAFAHFPVFLAIFWAVGQILRVKSENFENSENLLVEVVSTPSMRAIHAISRLFGRLWQATKFGQVGARNWRALLVRNCTAALVLSSPRIPTATPDSGSCSRLETWSLMRTRAASGP